MIKNLVIGSLLAAVVLMVWGFLTWVILSGALGIVSELPQEEAVRQALAAGITDDGAYFLPMAGFEGSEAETAAWAARHTEGPLVFLFFRGGGVAPS